MLILPNFLFVGPDKCGTTWFYKVLKEHPECYVPDQKDLYFFDRYYDKGIEWYGKFFRHGKHHTAVGEVCHDYISSVIACTRIRQDLGRTKIVICLRNPLERSVSNYYYLVKHGFTEKSFEEAINEFSEIIANSLYYENLNRYIETFGRENVHIVTFDLLKSDPESVTGELYSFLGIDSSFRPRTLREGKVLPAAIYRNRHLAKFVKKMATKIRDLGYPQLVGKFKFSPLVNKLLYKSIDKGDLTILQEIRIDLCRRFMKDIEAVETIASLDLSLWKSEFSKL